MKRLRLRLVTAVTATAALAAGGAVWLGTAPAAAVDSGTAGAQSAVLAAHAGTGQLNGMDSRPLLTAPLAPSVPGDPAIFGEDPGNVPWVIRAGHVVLSEDGALQAEVSGLIVPNAGKNPVPQIAAAVYCGGTRVATTSPVSFSPKGDAHLRATVVLPAFCAAPAVLLEPAKGGTVVSVYIAFDGEVR